MQVDNWDELEDYDVVLPAQFFGALELREPTTAEGRIAWKKFHRDACDCVFGPAKQRLIYIREIWEWMRDGKAGYSFSFWVEKLNERNDRVLLDEDWLFEGWTRFLQTQRADAINVLNGEKSANDDSDNWAVLKGKRGATGHPVIAHLPVRTSDDLLCCQRCGLIANRLEMYEEIVCESINSKARTPNGFRDGMEDGKPES